MVEESEQTQNQWMSIDQSSGVEIDKTVALITESMVAEGIVAIQPRSGTKSNDQLGVTERAFSAAGAAFLSAIIVNPLDVAKVGKILGLQDCVLCSFMLFIISRLCNFAHFSVQAVVFCICWLVSYFALV